jgi:hypothetical protein
MHAVRRHEATGAVRNRNHRIEKPTDLRNHGGQLVGVRLRQLALIRRGLHGLERECSERDPVATEWLAIDGECSTAGVLDLLLQLRNFCGRRTRLGDFLGGQPNRPCGNLDLLRARSGCLLW